MNAKFDALVRNQTWILVPPKSDVNIIGCKLVYRVKRHADSRIERFKSRLFAKGYNQHEGIHETFSPVVKPLSIPLVLSIALYATGALSKLISRMCSFMA